MVRVLLVDDSVFFLLSLEYLLARLSGVAVIGRASGAREGLLVARRDVPDLVLLDLMLPDRNGIDALADFKRLTPVPRVVLMSMHAGREYEHAARAAGADGFVTKADLAKTLPGLLASLNAGRGWESGPWQA